MPQRPGRAVPKQRSNLPMKRSTITGALLTLLCFRPAVSQESAAGEWKVDAGDRPGYTPGTVQLTLHAPRGRIFTSVPTPMQSLEGLSPAQVAAGEAPARLAPRRGAGG